ncbi:MAG: hypothetical protein ACYCTH_15490 [Cellulomonas sp.]
MTAGDVLPVELPLEELRRRVALVNQEHHVFVGTLAENLRLARSDADDDAPRRALVAADGDHAAPWRSWQQD